MSESPLISVIVPVFNDPDGLTRCLRALRAQTHPQHKLQIIVADNGSHVDIKACVDNFAHVELVIETKPGSYAARNRALQVAEGTLLAFTDADCQPHPEWLANAAAALEFGALDAVVGGDVELFALDPHATTWTELYELSLGFPQRFYVEQRKYTVTANLVTTRRVFDRVGPFDAGLKSAGDKEWCGRAARAGFPILFAEDAVVRHPARREFAQLVGKKLRQASGQLGSASRKHSRVVAFTLVLLTACAPPILRMLRMRPMPNLGVLGRLRRLCIVWLMAVALQLVTVFELLRRAFGKPAER